MTTPENARAHPPETLEGWYALHQLFTVDRGLPVHASNDRGADSTPPVDATRQHADAGNGWTAWARVIGSKADVMVVHFAPTLDAIAEIQVRTRQMPRMAALRLEYSFLSVTEAGLYHLTAEMAREAAERGGTVGDES